jgi:hypothetical protein
VHHGSTVYLVSYREDAFKIRAGRIDRHRFRKICSLRLLFGELLIRLELRHQSPILLGSFDSRHSVSSEASRFRDEIMGGRITGSIASNVSRVASPRRDDGSWFSSIDDHSSRPFSGDRSQPAGFFGGGQSSGSFSHRGSGGRRSLRHVAGLFPFHVLSGRRTGQQPFRTAGAALCDRSRITQGTRSTAGQRYHERMWSAIATCGKQGRGFFDCLHQSIAAKLNSKPHQSLINP